MRLVVLLDRSLILFQWTPESGIFDSRMSDNLALKEVSRWSG